jgi:hypothetical protein
LVYAKRGTGIRRQTTATDGQNRATCKNAWRIARFGNSSSGFQIAISIAAIGASVVAQVAGTNFAFSNADPIGQETSDELVRVAASPVFAGIGRHGFDVCLCRRMQTGLGERPS